MTTLFTILHCSYPVAMVIIAILYARKPFFLPMKFYMKMTFHPEARKLFRLALAVLVLLFNFSFTRTSIVTIWSIPGFLFGMLLLHDKYTNATLIWLHDDKMLQGFAIALIMFTLMSPELYQLSVSLAFVLLTACIYPSRKIVRMAENLTDYPEFNGTESDVVRYY